MRVYHFCPNRFVFVNSCDARQLKNILYLICKYKNTLNTKIKICELSMKWLHGGAGGWESVAWRGDGLCREKQDRRKLMRKFK